VCVASGDNGSSDAQTDGAVHVDFPASSPHALGCGGTSLRLSATGTPTAETVWNDGAGRGATGGGVSDAFALPAWQSGAGVPPRAGSGGTGGTGRGVPDVAGDADPATGYQVLVDGKAMVIGGTSAVAPLWAALVCRLSQGLGRHLGLLQPAIYADAAAGTTPPGFRDITIGSNGFYTAGPGWDACTGLGVPAGQQLLDRLRSGWPDDLGRCSGCLRTCRAMAAALPAPVHRGTRPRGVPICSIKVCSRSIAAVRQGSTGRTALQLPSMRRRPPRHGGVSDDRDAGQAANTHR